MAPTQGYHYNQMQAGNVRKSHSSRTGIRVQPEAHLLLNYENQHWDKHVENNVQHGNTPVRVRSAPLKNPRVRPRGFLLSVVVAFFVMHSCKVKNL